MTSCSFVAVKTSDVVGNQSFSAVEARLSTSCAVLLSRSISSSACRTSLSKHPQSTL